MKFGRSISFLLTALMSGTLAPQVARAAPPVPFVYDWTGFYVGVHGGYGWGNKHWYFAPTGTDQGDHNLKSLTGGGQIGFNYEMGGWVVGMEAQASWGNFEGEHPLAPLPVVVFHSKADRLGTIAGRLGHAWGPSLLYVSGGAAFAREKFWITDGPIVVPSVFGPETRRGWMLGAGFEYGITPAWSAKIEYNYLNFGTIAFNQTTVNIYDIDQHMSVVKIGLNYRFWPR